MGDIPNDFRLFSSFPYLYTPSSSSFYFNKILLLSLMKQK